VTLPVEWIRSAPKLVFCRQDGQPLKIGQLHERLWSACRRAGLREIRWHDLRRSFASQLAIAGVPLNQIQLWLGHITINMTMRYAHLAPGSGASLIAALETPTSVAARWQPEQTEKKTLSKIGQLDSDPNGIDTVIPRVQVPQNPILLLCEVEDLEALQVSRSQTLLGLKMGRKS